MDYRYKDPLQVFDYHDRPLSFAIEDDGGQLFFAFFIDENETGDEYIYVPTDRDEMEPLLLGQVTVGEFISDLPDDVAYAVTYRREGDLFMTTATRSELVESLPNPDVRM